MTTQTSQEQKQSRTPPQSPPSKTRKVAAFWQRVTEGFALQELWTQFRGEARAGYGLYSAEVDWEAVNREKGLKRAWVAGRALFMAMLMKLSPARRVLLLIALVFLVLGRFTIRSGGVGATLNLAPLGVLILLMLLALELADRVTMKRDLEIAREIQRWLVPEAPPQVPGLDLAFATRPANTVAGDYYDALRRGDNGEKLLLVVADVAGKSVPAALLMATFQAGLHALASAGATLQELVDGLNRFTCARSLGGQRFTTAFLGELDLASRSMSYVSAGHNAPVLRRVEGSFERLEEGGMPFGIQADGRYGTGTIRLERGDLLLIFTDGVIETVDEHGGEYGEERLLHLLNIVPGETATETIRHLLEDTDRFAGNARQHDDITCLALRVT